MLKVSCQQAARPWCLLGWRGWFQLCLLSEGLCKPPPIASFVPCKPRVPAAPGTAPGFADESCVPNKAVLIVVPLNFRAG